jgi:hypothetical protein
MPHLDATPLDLPFSGTTPIARHCSYEGAKTALPRAGSQAWTIYLLLREEALTRHELTEKTGLPVTTICARLGFLLKHTLVHECGTVKGPHGISNTQYIAT